MNIIASVASGRRAGSEVAAPEDDRILRLLPVASSGSCTPMAQACRRA